MQQSLWYFNTWAFYKYEIKEAQVIEETEKQYTVIAQYGRQRVRKSEMSTTDLLFFNSKEEAEQGLIKFLKEEIASCKRRIEEEQKTIAKRKELLKERFNLEVE